MVMQVPKKKGTSTKMKVTLITMLIVLVASSALTISWIRNNRIPNPSPSDFISEEWMQFVPAGVDGLRFLNISQLSTYPDIFNSTVLLSLNNPMINISIVNVTYGLVIQQNDSIVSIIAMNASGEATLIQALTTSNLSREVYKNQTIYKINESPINPQNESWLCVYLGGVIFSEGGSEALDAVRFVIDATNAPFFANDSLKIGYQLVFTGQNPFFFSFFDSGNNMYNVRWEMRSASASSSISVRECLFFPLNSDVSDKYSNLTNTFYKTATNIYVSDNFIIAVFQYPLSDIRGVLMGIS